MTRSLLWLISAAVLAFTGPVLYLATKGDAAMAQATPPKPKLSVQHEERPDQIITLVGIEVPTIPGFACDVWCYESNLDNKAKGEAETLPDGSMMLTHTRGPTTVKSHIVPGVIPPGKEGGTVAYVDFFVTVTGKTRDDVMAISSLNPCWQMKRAEGFKSDADYVKSFVNQCFMFTEKGLTMLSETTRFPDTRSPLDDKRNTPPWVQNYPPVWERHPGQRPGSRGIGVDRPINTLAGEISRDGKYLVAMGCRQGERVGQVWHDCLHLTPNMREEYDEATNRISSHWRIYFMDNDPERLLRMFLADIKPETPAVSVEPGEGERLAVSSSNLPGVNGSLALRVLMDGQTASMDDAHRWRTQYWGAVTGGGAGARGRYYIWANPVAERVDLVVSVANTSKQPMQAQVEARLEVGDQRGLGAAGGVAGAVWEEGRGTETPPYRAAGELGQIAPGESKTLRGRVYFAKTTADELTKLRADDLAEWSRAVPFKRALPE